MTVLILIIVLPINCHAEGSEYSELYSVSDAEKLNNELNTETKNILNEFNISLDDPSSLSNLNGFDLIKKLISKSMDDMSSPLFALSAICVMAVIYAVLFGAAPELGSNNGLISYILPSSSTVIIAMALVDVVKDAASSVSSCSVFMLSFIPIYSGIIISCGRAATGGAYSSLMFITSQVFCSVADNLLIPLCSSMMISSIGAAFNSLCGRISGLIKKASVTVLTFGMTLFTFMLGLQTAISSVSDSVGIKATKSAIGTFVPIIGSSLSESLSVILGSMSLFRSTMGAYAIICLAVMVVPPIVSILVWKAVLGLLGIVTQTVGADSTANMLSMMSGVLTILMCVLLCCTAAYIVSVALTLSVGG